MPYVNERIRKDGKEWAVTISGPHTREQCVLICRILKGPKREIYVSKKSTEAWRVYFESQQKT